MQQIKPGKALLLDLDCTLADSLEVMQGAYHNFLARHGKAGSEVEFQALNGPPLAEVVDCLRRSHELSPETPELLRQYENEIDRAYGQASPMPGARDLLSQVKALGFATAVVTSNSRARAGAWLAAAGLAPLIDGMVCGDEIEMGKPDAAPYIQALELLGLPAGRAWAVEDSPLGARAAVSAGLETFVRCDDGKRDRDWPRGVRFVSRLEDIPAVLKDQGL